METKTFVYTFSVDGPRVFDSRDQRLDEHELDVRVIADGAHLMMNRAGLLALAKLMIKLAEGRFEDGFEVQLSKNFGADDDVRLYLSRTPDKH